VDHPSEETLKRFASDVASREQNRTVVAHLLKGCAECAGKLSSLLEPEPVAESSYDAALDRLDRGLIDRLERTREWGGGLPFEASPPVPLSLTGEGERGGRRLPKK
jgi:hypothetical protein